MKRVNYHTHTFLCRHAGGTSEDYVIAAMQNGLDALGVSDHAAFPDDRFGLRMRYTELEPYIEDLNRLKSQYHNSLQLYAGLEIEYCPDMLSFYVSLLQPGKLDYLLLGQHFYSRPGQETVNVYMLEKSGSTADYIDYAQSVREGLQTGYFSILAHPDLIFLNHLPWDDNCEAACDIIIEAAKDAHVLLEVNANGLRRDLSEYSDGLRCPYPHPAFWQKAAKAGLPVIVGSDCHNPGLLWDSYVEETYRLCREWGLQVVDTIPLPSLPS